MYKTVSIVWEGQVCGKLVSLVWSMDKDQEKCGRLGHGSTAPTEPWAERSTPVIPAVREAVARALQVQSEHLSETLSPIKI